MNRRTFLGLTAGAIVAPKELIAAPAESPVVWDVTPAKLAAVGRKPFQFEPGMMIRLCPGLDRFSAYSGAGQWRGDYLIRSINGKTFEVEEVKL